MDALHPAVAEDEHRDRAGERRQLTVMFCDLVGSTELAQGLDAEDLRSVVRAYQKAASAVIERYAGHVAQYLGDGLLVYFGYPQAHEDDAERAVRAGLEIVRGVSELRVAGLPDVRLRVRIGIHTGPVVVGEMGGGARSEVLALGDTSNVAARVEGAAGPDTVAITAATQRLVAGLFVVEERGAQALKGVRDPVTLYRVVQPSGVRSRLEVAAGRLTRFVGRDMELGTLIDRWERARDGEGQAVVVLGEAGVGKSRLVYQLHEHLADGAHTWLECGATPYTEGSPFHPIIALVTEGLGFTAGDSNAERLAKVEVGLGTLASAESVPLLADFLGLSLPTPIEISPELQRRKTIHLLVAWTLSLGATQPLVLFVEDLHWCDVSTLELLGMLIAQTPTARVLLLATARPEFTPPWPTRSSSTTVQLARLTRRQARDMVVGLAGPGLSPDAVDALVARADGMPLYLEELTKAVTERGAAQDGDGIPTSLADSLMARLDRLAAAKDVAQRAAVLGREFGYPFLAAMADADEAVLRQGLTRLVEAEILFARGEPPEATYVFKHALIQETAYRSLLKRTRQELHARAARVLEERFPERARAEPEVIARHYDQAGLADPAIAHYQRAGEGATRRSAHEEAIGHLRRALALVATLPQTRERHRRELGIQMAIGSPLTGARGWSHPERAQTFVRARELASQIGASPELPRVLVGLADVHVVRGDLATGLEVAEEALRAAERTQDPFDRLSAHEEVGVCLLFQGHFAGALEHFETSIALYDPGTHGPLAYAVGFDRGLFSQVFAAWCHTYLGHPDRGLASIEAAVAVARRLAHPFSVTHALYVAAHVHFELGHSDRVRACVDDFMGPAESLGFPTHLAWGRIIRGWLRVEAGVEVGIAEMQRSLDELEVLGVGVVRDQHLAMLATVLWRAGRHDDALSTLDHGHDRAGPGGQHFYDAELHRLRAGVLLDMDEAAADEAEAVLHRALRIARKQEARAFELRAATSLARLWQRQGKRDEARALLGPVYGWFTEGFTTRDLRDAGALLEELG